MRIGIFSDIHSNLEALEAVIGAYKKEAVDTYYCLGDIVGYGASPCECITIVKDIAQITLAGNHDWAVVSLFPLNNFNDWAKQAVLWTQEKICIVEQEFLASLELVYESEDLILVHGGLSLPEEFPYIRELFHAVQTFNLMNKQICFIGHTHIRGFFVQDKAGNVSYSRETMIKLQPGRKYIVNVGSVGQPRDGNSEANYCVYDTDKQEVFLNRAGYDIKTAQKKILNEGLPKALADRLSIGL